MRAAAIYQPAPIQTTWLVNKTITWNDATTENVKIDPRGYFYLNGVRKKLVGINSISQFAAGSYWDDGVDPGVADNLGIFETQLSYLQGQGMRVIRPSLLYTTEANAGRYTGVLDLLKAYKMLVIPGLCYKGLGGFDNLTTTDFALTGENLSVAFPRWVNAMLAYDNVVALKIENELDLATTADYSLANVTTYFALLYNAVKAISTTVPITTNFVWRNYSAFAQSIQDALLPYTTIPSVDIYATNPGALNSKRQMYYDWLKSKGRNQASWIMECNQALAANSFTTAQMNACLAEDTALVVLFAMNYTAVAGYEFFDAAGAPIANMDTLMGNMATWQAAL